jgi:hypothetical protein
MKGYLPRLEHKEKKMELPIDASKLQIIVIGEVLPVFVYGTTERKKNAEGLEVFKIPVLIQGNNRQDPTTTISVAGALPTIPKGSRIQATDLTLLTWSMRGRDGNTRNGTTLRAKSVALFQGRS